MVQTLPVVVAAAVLLVTYVYSQLRYKRFKQFAQFPQLPTSLMLGHLKYVDQFIRQGKLNGHPDLAFAAINEELGRPALMLLDLRPVGPPMVIVRDYEVAEQIAKPFKTLPYGLPKMPSVYGHMVHVTGPTSILPAQGEHWKTLRKRFNPGFAPQHVLTMLPIIVEKSSILLQRVHQLARLGATFSLVQLTGNLTFDVISSVAMDRDFGAQSENQQDDFIRTYHELFESYASEQVDLPWFLTPRLEWRRRRLAARLHRTLKSVVIDAFAKRKAGLGAGKSRSILSLSLQNVETLTTDAINEACDQLKTFLFAGHDTTSILISWMVYELWRAPRALRAMRAEVVEVFGPDPTASAISAALLFPSGPEILTRMPYASAVIKETLRLWPPAGTARMTCPGAGLSVQTRTGEEYSLEGVHVYNCAIMIQRDPSVYGDTVNDFRPERWLGNAADTIPVGAWRAFERGPRNCIGQELAMLEARVVLTLLVCKFDFTKIGIGCLRLDDAGQPILGENGSLEVEEEMYPTRQVTPKPVDGMMMKVKKSSQ